VVLDPTILLQPFQYEFFTRAILVSVLVGGVCGLLGVYIILRGMSYMGHGMSHAVFGGAVVSYVAGFNFYIGDSKSLRRKTNTVEIVFSLILATVVIASMNSIGVTLLAAAIVAPAISAKMITNNFSKMVISSTMIGVTISFLGMYSSYFFDSASGSTIVLYGAGAFGVCSLYAYLRKLYQTHSHGTPHIHVNEHKHEHLKKP
jgi:ABC-type Mn2+/Zn2+ transport system permease subunit